MPEAENEPRFLQVDKILPEVSVTRDEGEFLVYGIKIMRALANKGTNVKLALDAGLWIGKASDRILHLRGR